MSYSILLLRFTFLVAMLSTAACSNKDAVFIAAPQDAEKGSVVYIYRPSSSSNFMMSPKLLIDDSEKFKIASGDYRYVYLPSGSHTVGLLATDQYFTDAALTVNVEADKSYYLRVNTSLKFEAEKMNTRKFWIDVVAEKDALAEIADTDYSGPRAQQPGEVQADAEENSPGFSVDKTQDPFAGKY